MRFSIFLALFVLLFSAHGQAPPTIDGYTYKTVKIGEQEWFAENLRTTVYANGDAIPSGLTSGEWTSTRAGATAVYGEGSSSCKSHSPDIDACDEAQSLAAYGRLYNWWAVDDKRGLCPSGWHVPSDNDWHDLEVFLGMSRPGAFTSIRGRDSDDEVLAAKLKAKSGWSKIDGTDDFGFSALPGGDRDWYYGDFENAGSSGYWWSSSLGGGYDWYRNFYDLGPDIPEGNGLPKSGFSVRCLRDAD